MPDSESFSRRYGFRHENPPITIWDDAPERFRQAVIQIAKEDCGLSAEDIRVVVCKVLRTLPDTVENWSEPNVMMEIDHLMTQCPWFKVYDIIEVLCEKLDRKHVRRKTGYEPALPVFEVEVTDVMAEQGIGWKLEDGCVQARGEESYEEHLQMATDALEKARKPTAITELKEAIGDISRRPEPDTSGAIQHAMAALECVARDVSGDPKPTLGALIKKHPDLFPKPVDDAVGKLWGYASENARHGREGNEPTREDAMLVVGIAATLVNYLIHKTNTN